MTIKNKPQENEVFAALFRQAFPPQPLPTGHAQRFLRRLDQRKQVRRLPLLFKIAAVALLLIGLGSGWQLIQNPAAPELEDFYQTEQYFSQTIQVQLDKLSTLDHPPAERILADAKTQLERLQLDYTRLGQQFKKDGANPRLIHAMIDNLQEQLTLLNDLNTYITSLKNQDHAHPIL